MILGWIANEQYRSIYSAFGFLVNIYLPPESYNENELRDLPGNVIYSSW